MRIVDVSESPRRVAEAISSCAAVVSSSLHGVIVADSFAIPAAWTTFQPALEGGDFKFRDHDAAMDSQSRGIAVTEEATVAHLVDAAIPVDSSKVAAVCDTLESQLSSFVRYSGLPRS